MASITEISIPCWVVCATHRRDALAMGYNALINTLKHVCGDLAVMDIQTVDELREITEAHVPSQQTHKLLIAGHRTDLLKCSLDGLRNIDVLELQFTTAASAPRNTADGLVFGKDVPWCSIPELTFCLSRATSDHFASQQTLNALINAYRGEAHESMLTPLLPLAVLVDGFLVAHPRDTSDWFKPAIEAALDNSSLMCTAVEAYWISLTEDSQPVNRIREMLRGRAAATPGFTAVWTAARALGWTGGDTEPCDSEAEAGVVYRRACGAVKATWDVLTSKDGVPPGGTEMRRLAEAASVGFYVLAAGHL
jgi:hypothetical protein